MTMKIFLLIYLSALFVPLFINSLKWGLGGLGTQALVSSLILSQGQTHWGPATILQLADFLLLRAVIVPVYLYFLFKKIGFHPPTIVFPQRVFLNVLTFLMVVLFGLLLGKWSSRENFADGPQLACTLAAVFVGLLVISYPTYPMAQVLGVFILESGIGLWKATLTDHFPLPVQLGITLVFGLMLLVFGKFLERLMKLRSLPFKGEVKETL